MMRSFEIGRELIIANDCCLTVCQESIARFDAVTLNAAGLYRKREERERRCERESVFQRCKHVSSEKPAEVTNANIYSRFTLGQC